MNGGKEAILGGVNYKLCLREGSFSLPFALTTLLILLLGLLPPQPLVPTAQRQPSQEGKHSPELVSAAAKRQKQLQLGSLLLLASVFKPSFSAGALLLPLARLVTYSQTPQGLHISTLHLPPAHDPVPVLNYPRESHFSYLPLPALPAEWQHGTKSKTHHCLAQPNEHQALWGKLECRPSR